MRKGSVKNTLYPSTLGRFCPAKRRMFWCLNLDFPAFPENDKYSLRSLINLELMRKTDLFREGSFVGKLQVSRKRVRSTVYYFVFRLI